MLRKFEQDFKIQINGRKTFLKRKSEKYVDLGRGFLVAFADIDRGMYYLLFIKEEKVNLVIAGCIVGTWLVIIIKDRRIGKLKKEEAETFRKR